MNKELVIYTELDCLYDVRKAMLSWLISDGITDLTERKQKADTLWAIHLEKNYRERKFDTFSNTTLGLNRARFDEAYVNRHVGQWVMYEPTQVLKKMLKSIFDFEQLEDEPLGLKGMTLHINYFPYELDEDLKKELISYAKAGLNNLVDVKLMYSDPKEQTSTFYRQFGYVLKYDVLLGKDSKKFSETLKDFPIPDVTFFVPNILLHETKDLAGEAANQILGISTALAPLMRLVPIDHSFYDARPK